MDLSPQTFAGIPAVIYYHYKEGNINYVMTSFSVAVHFLAVYGLYIAPVCKQETLLWAFLLWPLT